MKKLDVLAFGAHPDDIELSCSGTLLKMKGMGYSIGAVDLTRGELGTRGTPITRAQEAAAAAEILGISHRENLGFKDGFFQNDETHQRAIIRVIRALRPEILLVNAPSDRHPDHGRGHDLIRDAAFLSGLLKVQTKDINGNDQEPWRPKNVFAYIQDRFLQPSFVVDISPYFDTKVAAIRAYGTQFFQPGSEEPETYISTEDFWHHIHARARFFGHMVGCAHGEGFIAQGPLKIDNPLNL